MALVFVDDCVDCVVFSSLSLDDVADNKSAFDLDLRPFPRGMFVSSMLAALVVNWHYLTINNKFRNMGGNSPYGTYVYIFPGLILGKLPYLYALYNTYSSFNPPGGDTWELG